MQSQFFSSYEILLSDTSDGSFYLHDRTPVFADWIVPDQVHETTIVTITDSSDINPESLLKTDGIVSNLPDLIFWVKLADCNGVVIVWKEWFAVLHAGWRGLAGGIIEKALEKLISLGEDISQCPIYVSPSICSCCYEVDSSFLERFPANCFRKKEGKIYFDMILYIQSILRAHSIPKESIHIHPDCTCCNEKYYSYRREKTDKRIVFGIRKKL